MLIFFNTQFQVIRPSGKEVLEGVGSLRVVVNVGGCAEVSLVGEGSDLGRDLGACNGARIHLPEHHPGRFDEPKRGVHRKELVRWTRREGERVVHRETVRSPVEVIAGYELR